MKSACAEKHIDTQNTNSPKIQTYRYIYTYIADRKKFDTRPTPLCNLCIHNSQHTINTNNASLVYLRYSNRSTKMQINC